MEAVGGEEGENEEANSGTVFPCKFLPMPVFLLSGILERVQAFHVHRELEAYISDLFKIHFESHLSEI